MKKFKSAVDYLCDRWHSSKAFLEVLRTRLSEAQPGSKDRLFFTRRIKQIEIEAGLWEGRINEGEKRCTSRHAN